MTVHDAIVREVRKVIVGQEEVLDQVLISLFVGGHCLITGLPGTAKTLLVRTIAQTLGLVFKRIQFTPDLMPSDITGTDIIEEDPTTGRRTWTFVPGPIFANVLLADEINRTPPKTQSALLEAMQELSCTVRGHVYQIDAAVLRAGHPEPDRARRHLSAARSAAGPLPVQYRARLPVRRRRSEGAGSDHHDQVGAAGDGDQLPKRFWISSSWFAWCRSPNRWPATRWTWCARTRPNDAGAPDFVKKYVNFGASVRAAQSLVLAAKARALMHKRYHVSLRRRPHAGRADSAPSHAAELPRRIRTPGFGRHSQAAARGEPEPKT